MGNLAKSVEAVSILHNVLEGRATSRPPNAPLMCFVRGMGWKKKKKKKTTTHREKIKKQKTKKKRTKIQIKKPSKVARAQKEVQVGSYALDSTSSLIETFTKGRL